MTSIKEKILEEFDKLEGLTFGSKEDKRESYKQFLSQAIDQTREETIRECINVLPEREKLTSNPISLEGDIRIMKRNELLEEIKQSLKSLINK